MPRPIAAGVFGIARTMALPGKARSRNASVLPAMIETTTVEPSAIGASGGTTLSATCGFTAMTIAPLVGGPVRRIELHAARA